MTESTFVGRGFVELVAIFQWISFRFEEAGFIGIGKQDISRVNFRALCSRILEQAMAARACQAGWSSGVAPLELSSAGVFGHEQAWECSFLT